MFTSLRWALSALFFTTLPATAFCDNPWAGQPSNPTQLDPTTPLTRASALWLEQTAPTATTFHPVQIQTDIQNTPITLIYCVGHDYLRMGNPASIYLAPNVATIQTLLDQWDIIPPTRLMVDQIQAVAQRTHTPHPRTPSPQMTQLREGRAHFSNIGAPFETSDLLTGHKKDIVLGPTLFSSGKIAIYGWFDNGAPIQPYSLLHGADYGDYSHGMRPILRWGQLNGEIVDLLWLLEHPNYHNILSDQGPVSFF